MHASKELSCLPKTLYVHDYKFDDNANLENCFCYPCKSSTMSSCFREGNKRCPKFRSFFMTGWTATGVFQHVFRLVPNIICDVVATPNTKCNNERTCWIHYTFIPKFAATTYIVIPCSALITICHFHMVVVHSVETIASVEIYDFIQFNSHCPELSHLFFSQNSDSNRVG